MSIIQVGIIDTTGTIDPNLVESVATAINIQVTRDLPQFWPVQATVQYLPQNTKLPAGVWPVQLVSELPPGEGGFHFDTNNQPFSKVIATPEDDTWSIDASHETIEMLIDSSGNRVQQSVAIDIVDGQIQDGEGQYNYLVEACDPCEANSLAYEIQGTLVSDFITPHFYDALETPGTRYSFTGAVKAPRQILPGGYISFLNLETNEWQQILYLSDTPELRTLGQATGTERSMRVWVNNDLETDYHDRLRSSVRDTSPERARRLRDRRTTLDKIAIARAELYNLSKPVV